MLCVVMKVLSHASAKKKKKRLNALKFQIWPFYRSFSSEIMAGKGLRMTLLVHAGYFGVSIIHRTRTWTTGSLTCVCDLFACIYTSHGGPRFIVSSEGLLVESAQNLTQEESHGVPKA